MLNPLSLLTRSRSTWSSTHRTLGLAATALAIALLAGCGSGGKDSKNQVTGKVTLDGKAVAGTVYFQFPDNKELTSPISATDGAYQIIDAPNGQAKVSIKGGLGGGAPTSKPPAMKGAPEMPEMGGGPGGVAPPKKYGSPTTSGLTFEVKGGKQTYDIPLTP